jgi:NADH-quinone oxidoreductase subunit M
MNDLAMQGAVVVIVASALSAAGLFAVAGQIHERTGERNVTGMGGLWGAAPRLGGAGLFFALASLGLPGLASFVGEFLVLLGAYRVSVPLTAVAAGGMVLSVIYAVWMFQRIFHGPAREDRKVADLGGRELAMLAALIAAVLWLGLYPRPVLKATEPVIVELRKAADRAAGAAVPPAPAGLVERPSPDVGGSP